MHVPRTATVSNTRPELFLRHSCTSLPIGPRMSVFTASCCIPARRTGPTCSRISPGSTPARSPGPSGTTLVMTIGEDSQSEVKHSPSPPEEVIFSFQLPLMPMRSVERAQLNPNNHYLNTAVSLMFSSRWNIRRLVPLFKMKLSRMSLTPFPYWHRGWATSGQTP